MRDFSRFREDGQDGRVVLNSGIVRWSPIMHGTMLAFDQSLGHCGWVHFANALDGIHLYTSGVLTTDHDQTTMVGRVAAATSLEQQVKGLLISLRTKPTYIFMETPAAPRPGIVYSDSPVLAAAAIHTAIVEAKLPPLMTVLVSSTAMKTRWTGSNNASKRRVRDAVVKQMPSFPLAFPKAVEHQYDAMGIGMLGAEGAGTEI